MNLLVLILKKANLVNEICKELTEEGVHGGTILDGIGMASVIEKMDDLPIFSMIKTLLAEDDEGDTVKVMLFVMAIAIHNLPEGIAAGVGFGSDNIGNAVTVALGIALQNIPEGMIIVSPLIMAGVSKWRVFLIASFTGVIEIVGTLIGFTAVSVATAILPFALAFAGGTMIYVVSDEMIPETHSHGYEQMATYSLLFGFITMLIMDFYIG